MDIGTFLFSFEVSKPLKNGFAAYEPFFTGDAKL
jgi:hypothetical protein